MADYFNEDFKDFIRALNNQEVSYVLVGGMAVILHGYVRTTGDMDIWVKRTKENYQKIKKAFYEFQMPVFDMTEERFLSDEYDVWMFGVEPVKIELMTAVKGLDFDETFALSEIYMEDNIPIRFLHINSLLAAKKAAGRFKDLDDIEKLHKKKKK
jgi:acyl carrier protein phosphodiesterase